MANAGRFEIIVYDPYPCCCQLKYADGDLSRVFTHKELSDLKYCVEKAMQEAKLKLGKDRDEV